MAPPGGVREAVQTLCLLLLVSALFTALRWLVDDAAPGLPRLFAQEPPYACPQLWLWAVAAGLLLVTTFPAYPALRSGWWRELLPLLAGAVILAPGFPLFRVWPGPPELLLLAVVAFTFWWRRRRPGWVVLKAAVRDHLPRSGPRAAALTLGGVLLVHLFSIQFTEMDKVISGRTDFVTFYRAAEALAAAGDPYRDLRGFMYPPSFAFWFRPFNAFSLVEASLLWFVIKLTLVIWTFHLVDCLLVGRTLTGDRRGWFLVGLVMVTIRFWVADQQFGNTNNLLLFLTVGALAWSETRPWRSGTCLALATTVKVVPALLAFYLVVTRRWRALSWTAGVLMLLNLVPLATAPEATSRAWSSYYALQGSTGLTERRDQPDNQSLWGALARKLPVKVPQLRLAWACVSTALLLLGLWAAWRAQSRGPLPQGVAASLWPLFVLIVSPGSWVVHYVAMLLPLAALLRLLQVGQQRRRWLWALFWGANLVFNVSGWWRWSIRLAADRSLFLSTAVVIYLTLCWVLGRKAAPAQLRRDQD